MSDAQRPKRTLDIEDAFASEWYCNLCSYCVWPLMTVDIMYAWGNYS